jgi:hypothetical protein
VFAALVCVFVDVVRAFATLARAVPDVVRASAAGG